MRILSGVTTSALLRGRGEGGQGLEQKEMAAPLDSERLVQILSREIGQFESRVADLEEKCRQIHSCVASLAQEFRSAYASFSRQKEVPPAAITRLCITCGQNARTLVDKGQDLVDDLSAFIADFTESEKGLCALVEDFAQASRLLEKTHAYERG